MTDLIETLQWEDGIRQIETNDPVLGGVPNIALGEGIPNIPLQQLANRTKYLKDLLAAAKLLVAIKTVDGTGSGLDADLLDGLHASVFARKDVSETFDADVAFHGGDVILRAAAAGNAFYWLMDETGKREGALFWDRATDTIRLRRYNAAGTATEDEMVMGNGVLNINGAAVATVPDITVAINDLVDASPGALDTLNELAAALGDDPNFATTMTNALANKLGIAAKAADSAKLDGLDSSDYARKDDTATQTFAGDIITNGGNLAVDAAVGDNAYLYLRDDANVPRALMLWNRATNELFLRRIDGSTEGEIRFDPTGTIKLNGHKAWHDGDAANSLLGTGYQTLPSGLILQWGTDNVSNNGTVSFPISFPNDCLNVWTTDSNVGGTWSNVQLTGVASVSTSGFVATIFDTAGSAATGNGTRWLALGK